MDSLQATSTSAATKKRAPYDTEYYDQHLDPSRFGPNSASFVDVFDLPVSFYEENADIQDLWYVHWQLWALRCELWDNDIEWAPVAEVERWCEQRGYDTDDFWPIVEECLEHDMAEQQHAVPPAGGDAVQKAIYFVDDRIRKRAKDKGLSPRQRD